jgi:hypothetical protein
LQHVRRNCCHFFPDVLFHIHRCPWFLFVHLALEISSEEEVLRLGTLAPMNIELPTKYPLSQDRIVVFERSLHSKSPMLYRPALHGNSNALSLARRAFKNKFPTPTVPLRTVLPNCHVFLPDPVYAQVGGNDWQFMGMAHKNSKRRKMTEPRKPVGEVRGNRQGSALVRQGRWCESVSILKMEIQKHRYYLANNRMV